VAEAVGKDLPVAQTPQPLGVLLRITQSKFGASAPFFFYF
jgi:hypothetical protein